jgi:hypothetical protein
MEANAQDLIFKIVILTDRQEITWANLSCWELHKNKQACKKPTWNPVLSVILIFFETMINPLRTRSYVLIGKEVGTDSKWMLIRMSPEDSIMILIIRQHFDINLSGL